MVALLVMAAAAARITVGTVLWELPHPDRTPSVDMEPSAARSTPPEAEEPELEEGDSDAASTVVNAVLLGALMLVLFVAVLMLKRERGPNQETEELADPVGGDERGRVRDVAATAIDDALRTLEAEDAPDHAIVECWRRVEEAALTSGVAADPSRTSSELAVALLSETQADPQDVQELAHLYREARYAQGVVGDDDVARAKALLNTIRQGVS